MARTVARTREDRLKIGVAKGGIEVDGFMTGQVLRANIIADRTRSGDESDSDEL